MPSRSSECESSPLLPSFPPDRIILILIASFLFLISILFQILLARHHKREKRFGPSPTNGYTSGSRRRWFSRNKHNPDTNGADALPGHPTPNDVELNGAEAKNEKSWNPFGRKKSPSPTVSGPAGVQNGYGYGSSAYTGNY